MEIARKAAAAALVLLLAGYAGAGQAAELLTLVDSNGLAVGPIASIDDSGDELRVVFRVGKRTFLPQFRPGGVDGYGSVYYLTADCSGTPLMRVSSEGGPEFTDPYAIENPGPILFVRDYTKAAHTRTVLSTGAPGACGPMNLTAKFGVAMPVFDFSVYTPPFRIRANTSALQ